MMFAAKLSSKVVAHLHSWARVAPLVAAILAPFSVLFDIPALAETWFVKSDPNVLLGTTNGTPIPDPKGNVTLSAIGLAFNVIANALLIVRFSPGASMNWWRVATQLSIVSWICKVIIALTNVLLYARKLRPYTMRWEGFWCAIISLGLCVVITSFLIFHWVLLELRIGKGQEQTEDQLSIRLAGRHFMVNVILFVIDVGVLALVTSKVEHWTYFQGIYFTVTTFLTIGYGDFKPTHTVTRILTFLFAVLGIAQLGNIVTMLVKFFYSRAEVSRALSRAKFEQKRKEEEERKSGQVQDLFKEIEFLHRLGEQLESRIRLKQVTTNVAGLIVFWLIGSAVFSQIEGYGYATGLYFVYVSFLTIGYGDFAPVTPAGRAIFVLYSLLAVPIMASFAVQAVQHVMYAMSERVHDKQKTQLGLKPELTVNPTESKMNMSTLEQAVANVAAKPTRTNRNQPDIGTYHHIVVPHANLAEQWHEEWERNIRLRHVRPSNEPRVFKLGNLGIKATKENESVIASDSDERNEEFTAISEREEDGVIIQQEGTLDENMSLIEVVLELAISLESRARKLLITHLDEEDGGKSARIVLKADQNVQMRQIKAILREIVHEMEEIGEGEDNKVNTETGSRFETAMGDHSVRVEDICTSRFSRFQNGRMPGIVQRILGDNPNEPISTIVGRDERETLADIQRYREDFAGLLAAGARLMRLKGDERALFERRRIDPSEEL